LGIGPNPQSPIPNPQSPIPNPHAMEKFILKIKILKRIIYIILKKIDKYKWEMDY
jgi:hypothetical protein